MKPPTSPGGKCPVCKRPISVEFRPFCSKRCADVDLQRWFSGAYAIPVVEEREGENADQFNGEAE